MTVQASLFGHDAAPCGGQRPATRAATPRHAGLVRTPAAPYGKPDRSGKYWYERFHDDLQSIPVDAREKILEIILCWPSAHRDAARKILDRYCRAQIMEQDNFCEAMGR